MVWITGASSGLGAALARAFASEGARLVLSARRKEALERVRSECAKPEAHAVVPLDLACSAGFPALAEEVMRTCGRIDLLINNGGVSQRGLALETTEAVERRIMEVDYFGTVALTKAVAPHLVRRRSGRIVVISSVMGYLGTPMRSSYAAAKHALHGYFDSLRAELWRDGVRVTIVCPGYVRTAVSANALTADGSQHERLDGKTARGMDPASCAAKIVAGLSRGKDEIHVGGGELWGIWLQRWAPRLLARVVRKMDFGQERRTGASG